jgi:hypothetical protein
MKELIRKMLRPLALALFKLCLRDELNSVMVKSIIPANVNDIIHYIDARIPASGKTNARFRGVLAKFCAHLSVDVAKEISAIVKNYGKK